MSHFSIKRAQVLRRWRTQRDGPDTVCVPDVGTKWPQCGRGHLRKKRKKSGKLWDNKNSICLTFLLVPRHQTPLTPAQQNVILISKPELLLHNQLSTRYNWQYRVMRKVDYFLLMQNFSLKQFCSRVSSSSFEVTTWQQIYIIQI